MKCFNRKLSIKSIVDNNPTGANGESFLDIGRIEQNHKTEVFFRTLKSLKFLFN